jgi:holin-like protein
MKAVAVFAIQVVGLLAVNQAGHAAASLLGLPLPGSLLGMLLLLALLLSGAVRVRWLETSASFLLRHLAFFFVPITVGLMGFAAILAADGAAILVTLVVSACVGLCVAGLTSQVLARRRRGPA